jgi:hypothetical protein
MSAPETFEIKELPFFNGTGNYNTLDLNNQRKKGLAPCSANPFKV